VAGDRITDSDDKDLLEAAMSNVTWLVVEHSQACAHSHCMRRCYRGRVGSGGENKEGSRRRSPCTGPRQVGSYEIWTCSEDILAFLWTLTLTT